MSKEQNFIIAGAGDNALGAWGLQKTIKPYSLFHSLFTFDVPFKKWNSIINGTEESLLTSTLVTSVNGFLSVKTAANSGDITYLHSRRHPQYQSNRGHHYASSIRIPNVGNNAVYDFGLFTDINGVFFRVDSLGDLYACIQSDGVLEKEEKIPMPFELDYSKGNVFDIQFQWRGAGDFRFFAGNPKTGRIEVIHEIKNLNKLDALSIENPSLPAAYRVTSLGDAGELQSGCVDITSEGGDEKHEQYGSAAAIAKSTSGTNAPVLAIYSPALIGGKMNTRDIRLSRISGASDKRAVFKVWITRDPAALTGASFVSAGPGTYMQYDESATAFNSALANFVTAFRVEANSFQPINNPARDIIDFFLIHGDYLVITADVSTGTCDAVAEWGEET